MIPVFKVEPFILQYSTVVNVCHRDPNLQNVQHTSMWERAAPLWRTVESRHKVLG